jgi:coenzyme F420-0:L-glutamate ligase/coenzyme F420-1:gamma-L-glutamate ligase
VPLGPDAAPSTLEAFEQVLHGRRSIRAYRPDLVPRPLVEEVLAAAVHAPSPHHSALWRAAVLTRPEARAALAAAMAAAWRADLAADGLPEARIAAVRERSRARLEGAPVIVILSTTDERLDRYPDARRQEAERLMAAQSVGAALQNVMLAAHARGLASCWVCAPLFCPDTILTCLGLDPRLHPQALLTLGYPAAPAPARDRLGLGDLVVHWD